MPGPSLTPSSLLAKGCWCWYWGGPDQGDLRQDSRCGLIPFLLPMAEADRSLSGMVSSMALAGLDGVAMTCRGGRI